MSKGLFPDLRWKPRLFPDLRWNFPGLGAISQNKPYMASSLMGRGVSLNFSILQLEKKSQEVFVISRRIISSMSSGTLPVRNLTW